MSTNGWVKFPIDVTCCCGANLKSFRNIPAEVDKAVREFNEAHSICRTKKASIKVALNKEDT
jgi:hypothetical protein